MDSEIYESVDFNTECSASENTTTRHLSSQKLPVKIQTSNTGGCPKLRFCFIIITCLLAAFILLIVVLNMTRIEGMKNHGNSKDMTRIEGMKNHGNSKDMTRIEGMKNNGNSKDMTRIEGMKNHGNSKDMTRIEGRENNGNCKDFTATVVSDGCCRHHNTDHLKSLFFIDNKAICTIFKLDDEEHRRGFNFAVLKLLPSGTPWPESCMTFDTFGEDEGEVEMRNYMQRIPPGRLVLISVMDTGTAHSTRVMVSSTTRTLMRSFNPLSQNIDNIQYRGSFALVGYKGNCTPSWIIDERRPFVGDVEDAEFIRLDVIIPSSWKC